MRPLTRQILHRAGRACNAPLARRGPGLTARRGGAIWRTGAGIRIRASLKRTSTKRYEGVDERSAVVEVLSRRRPLGCDARGVRCAKRSGGGGAPLWPASRSAVHGQADHLRRARSAVRPRGGGLPEARGRARRAGRPLSAEHPALSDRLFRRAEGRRHGCQFLAARRDSHARAQDRGQRDGYPRHPRRRLALPAGGEASRTRRG